MAAFFAVSCASTPKDVQDSIDVDEIALDENEDAENQGGDVFSEGEETSCGVEAVDLEATVSEEPLSQEKVFADELPELEDEKEAEEVEDFPPIEEEPSVKDEEPEVEETSGGGFEDVEGSGLSGNEALQDGKKEDSDAESQTGIGGTLISDDSGDAVSGGDISVELEEDGLLSEEDSSKDASDTPEKVERVPSRKMEVPKNQMIDITYPGKGWIYQGCIDSEGNVDVRNRYFVFGGRKLGGENTSFTLRSRVPGKYLLHFYKNDALTGTYIDDYLEVSVRDEPSRDSSRVQAPSYAEFVPPKVKITADSLKMQKKKQEDEGRAAVSGGFDGRTEKSPSQLDLSPKAETQGKKSEPSELKTVVQTDEDSGGSMAGFKKNSENSTVEAPSPSVTEEPSVQELEESFESPRQILKEAKDAYEAKNYERALELAARYIELAAESLDEGLFLKAQVLESKSKVQDIREAVRLYDLLVRTYPRSRLWDRANERSIYLKRMYINIR